MNTFYWVAISVVTVLSSARLTRLAVVDDFPPVKWLRMKVAIATDGSDWQAITYCPYCVSFWMTLIVVLSGYFSDWHTVWWIVAGSLAASYPGSVWVAYEKGDD